MFRCGGITPPDSAFTGRANPVPIDTRRAAPDNDRNAFSYRECFRSHSAPLECGYFFASASVGLSVSEDSVELADNVASTAYR